MAGLAVRCGPTTDLFARRTFRIIEFAPVARVVPALRSPQAMRIRELYIGANCKAAIVCVCVCMPTGFCSRSLCCRESERERRVHTRRARTPVQPIGGAGTVRSEFVLLFVCQGWAAAAAASLIVFGFGGPARASRSVELLMARTLRLEFGDLCNVRRRRV